MPLSADGKKPSADVIESPGALHFEFYSPGGADALLGDVGAAGARTITKKATHEDGIGDHDTTDALIRDAKVHAELRFALFARVRLAKLGASVDGAALAAQIRLLSFCVLLQSDAATGGSATSGANGEASDQLGLVFLAEPQPEFIAELLRALRMESRGVPARVTELTLRVLAALAGDRNHQGGVIAALRNDGNVAVFASLVSKAVTALTDAPSPPIGPALVAANLPKLELDAMNAEADAPVPLADALVGLLSTLVTSHAGCQCLRDVSLLPVLLPLLKNRNPRHVHIVAHAVHVLEVFIDYTSAAATAFRELGGIELIVDRLKAEAEDALAEHEATHGAAFTAAAAAAAEAGTPAPTQTYLVSSTRRVLLKALMRALAVTSFAPGTSTAATTTLEEGSPLCHSLNLMFENPRLFGAGVFSLASNLLSDVMNHEPTCYPKLDALKVPETFLRAWEMDDPGPLPSADALCCLPNTLGALCLSPLGLERVKNSRAFNALVIAFTTRSYSRAMQGDTASVIGGNMDELLRHVPDLLVPGVGVALNVLRRLVDLGGGDAAACRAAGSLDLNEIKGASEGAAATNAAIAGDGYAHEVADGGDGAAVGSERGEAPMDTDDAPPTAPTTTTTRARRKPPTRPPNPRTNRRKRRTLPRPPRRARARSGSTRARLPRRRRRRRRRRSETRVAPPPVRRAFFSTGATSRAARLCARGTRWSTA